MNSKVMAAVVGGVVIVVAAVVVATSKTPGTSNGKNPTTPSPAKQDNSLVKVMSGGKNGPAKYLADKNGITLYMFKQDKASESACNDKCAEMWPPFLAPDQANGLQNLPKDDLHARLGTIIRKDGKRQITLGATSLYYYSGDKAVGEIKGAGIPDWDIVAP